MDTNERRSNAVGAWIVVGLLAIGCGVTIYYGTRETEDERFWRELGERMDRIRAEERAWEYIRTGK